MRRWVHVRLGASVLRAALGTLAIAWLPATASEKQPDDVVPPCATVGTAEALCGVRSPEDLDFTLDRRYLLVSQISAVVKDEEVWLPGSLAMIEIGTNRVLPLYPVAGRDASAEAFPEWGDAQCPGEIGAAMSPHGIHVSRRSDGSEQLLVVNHGARQSVEMFEIRQEAGRPVLAWRGCAQPPQPAMLNDVAALPDGGFLATNYTRLGGPNEIAKANAAAEQGKDTGELLRWHPARGFAAVPGTESAVPNGVQADAAGRHAFFATKTEIRKIDLEKGAIVATAPVALADNLNWTADGRVLTARITDSAEVYRCFEASGDEPCLAAFEVIAVDPRTMRHEVIGTHSGPPLGAATVAAQHGGHLYIGSFIGDRVMRMPYPMPATP